MEEVKAEDQRGLAGYLELIGELKGRVSHLEATLSTIVAKYETAISTLRDEHIACLETQAEFKAKVGVLDSEVKSLREWRHDVAGNAQTIVNKATLQAMQDSGVIPKEPS